MTVGQQSLRVKEGQHINKSLFFLTQVIAMRAEGSKDHIPYRNSPLTKILKTSLAGNSRTAIILCITPSLNQLEQTVSTLRFGQNAKKIKNKVGANLTRGPTDGGDLSDKEAHLNEMIAQFEKRMAELEKNRSD